MTIQWLQDAAEMAQRAAYPTTLTVCRPGVLVATKHRVGEDELEHHVYVSWNDLVGARFNPLLPAIEAANNATKRALGPAPQS